MNKMGLIKLKLPIKGDIDTKEFEVLFDSGSNTNVIPKSLAEKVCTIDEFSKPEMATLADGKTKVKITGSCKFSTNIYGKYYVEGLLKVIDTGTDKLQNGEMYIGAPLMEENCIKMIFGKSGKKPKEKSFDYLDFSDYGKRNSI